MISEVHRLSLYKWVVACPLHRLKHATRSTNSVMVCKIERKNYKNLMTRINCTTQVKKKNETIHCTSPPWNLLDRGTEKITNLKPLEIIWSISFFNSPWFKQCKILEVNSVVFTRHWIFPFSTYSLQQQQTGSSQLIQNKQQWSF